MVGTRALLLVLIFCGIITAVSGLACTFDADCPAPYRTCDGQDVEEHTFTCVGGTCSETITLIQTCGIRRVCAGNTARVIREACENGECHVRGVDYTPCAENWHGYFCDGLKVMKKVSSCEAGICQQGLELVKTCAGSYTYCSGDAAISVNERCVATESFGACPRDREGENCKAFSDLTCTGTSVSGTLGYCEAGSCHTRTLDQDCNDGLPCNGQETCDKVSGCVAGNPVDCSPFNLPEIRTCTYSPDDNPLTLDIFPGFTSSCDEGTGTCTTGTVTLSHTLSEECGAMPVPEFPPVFPVLVIGAFAIALVILLNRR